MAIYYIYPIYTFSLIIIAYALVPRVEIRRLIFFGIIFGTVFDISIIVLGSKILEIFNYINYGPFEYMGIPFFPPIAWAAYFIIFLYHLPEEKPWNYLFVFTAAGYSTLFSNVLRNLGLFQWNYGTLIIPFLIYFSWHLTITWVYYKLTSGMENNVLGITNSLFEKEKAKNLFKKRGYAILRLSFRSKLR